MQLYVSVRSSDPNVKSEIAQMKINGVTIKQQKVIKEISNPLRYPPRRWSISPATNAVTRWLSNAAAMANFWPAALIRNVKIRNL